MRKVLLVEDEELILQGVRNIIEWEKYDMEVVYMAHNGREAMDFLTQENVDIIVSDIQMPVMDGLEFLKIFREKNKRTRCILLTGYDEFEYARKGILLDVEDYILKPIDEEKLLQAVLKAEDKLKLEDSRKTADIEVNTAWQRFLSGDFSSGGGQNCIEMLPIVPAGKWIFPALMKLKLDSLQENRLSDILVQLQKESQQLRVIYLSSDTLFLLCFAHRNEEMQIDRMLQGLQDELESRYGILTFISLGKGVESYEQLPEAYEDARKLQKYRIIEGYGACVCHHHIDNRTSQDITIDHARLRKAIFQKNKEEALSYVEDIFINNLKKDMEVNDFYRTILELAMLVQDIRAEYHMKQKKQSLSLTEMVEQIYQAEDLFTLKNIFMEEIIEIIHELSEDHSQYTPVVKQILAEVAANYQDDMNLKTLSHKYHMNTSYLGQIFQKEVGCSFNQYLSNTKMSMAKDMILNTNMRINDIAQTVGYPDTSYFYRKFKQCYGVSPASLREMKNY